MSAEVVEFSRKAKPEDYIETEILGEKTWKLSWQEYMLPGVLCDCPIEGAKEYNQYLKDKPAKKQASQKNAHVLKCYEWCLSEPTLPDKIAMARFLKDYYKGHMPNINTVGRSECFLTLFQELFLFNLDHIKTTLNDDMIQAIDDLFVLI